MLYSPIHKAITSLLSLAFAFGIYLAYQLNWENHIWLIAIAVTFALLLSLQFYKTSKHSVYNKLQLILLITVSITMGAFRLQSVYVPPNFKEINTTSYLATVQSVPEERTNSYKIVAVIDSGLINNHWLAINTRVLIYFEKSPQANKLQPGEVVQFSSRLQRPSGASNPEGFDYSSYLSHQKIYATCYLSNDQWSKNYSYKHNIFTHAAIIQHKIVSHLSALPLGKEELGVLSALTVGYKKLLDDEQVKSYAASGATHVLAVSGLHVGILFVFLSRILLFGKSKASLYIKTMVIILLLWGFAFITGLSPSVCRATLMFSCISIGSAQKRKSNIYNMLFISAFILLFINPLNLFSLGFQLSYCAVLGILTFEPIFESFLHEKVHFYKPLSELFAVSIAAQLGTFPIAIHVFNTFPLYFLLTNVWIIPLVTVVLNGAIILIILCLINVPCILFAKGLNILLYIMNKGVYWISQLPYAQFNNIYLSKFQVVLIYSALVLLILAISYHHKKYLTLSALSILLIGIMSFQYSYKQKDKLYFFSFYHKEAFNCFLQEGNQAYIHTYAGDKNIIPDYMIHHHLKGKSLHATDDIPISSNFKVIKDFILSKDKLWVVYKKDLENYNSPIAVSALIIDRDKPKNIYQTYDLISFEELVFFERPKRFYYYYNFCKKRNIKMHVIQNDGAYIANCYCTESSALASAN